ncbi:MAG: LytTR family transcriptional regulator [Clostridia bacterium]|nr:LytTR family transcriptional regulator [Clostridia bacterium]
MKLRIEIDPDAPEEIIIRASRMSETVMRVQDAVLSALGQGGSIAVKHGESEIYLPFDELLFFETDGDKTIVHTASDCFFCKQRLGELSLSLPRNFVRASKSCLINTAKIRSISRTPTGVGTAYFAGSEKKAFISRMYYKTVREVIEQTRLNFN